MLIPLSWLTEFVDIKLPFPKLAEAMSAAGLTIEVWKEINGDIIFDPEVTPNRPDWMSIYGVAREVAAVTKLKVKSERFKAQFKIQKPSHPLKIDIKPNYEIVPRITSVIIKNVTVKPSPEWLQKRIKQIGLRPINNLVDITNYVLWTYGSLLHVFDYDKIRGHQMTVELSKGGEDFRSLDGLDYKLPKNAIIIKDVGRVIDLLPLKGGENTASFNETKNVLLHSVIVDPVITRRTSQALGLRSDSSAIAERGLDPNGTILAVNKALELILNLAGGEVASEIMDHKPHEFNPWTVEMSHQKMKKVLGIEIEPKMVVDSLERLELKTERKGDQGNWVYQVTVPTFRNDLHLEEDLIEEVGRIYGYNHFPKTLPTSAVSVTPVAYRKDYDVEYEFKQTLKGAGFNEIYSYSLISEDQLLKLGIDPMKTLRVDNPVSKEYEYLRPNLLGNLLDTFKFNQANFSDQKIFELGKRYLGETIDKVSEEYWLWAVLSGEKTLEIKGVVKLLLEKFGVQPLIRPALGKDNHFWFHPGRVAHLETSGREYLGVFGEVHPSLLNRWGINDRLTAFGLNYNLFEKQIDLAKKYHPIPKYPPVLQDLALIIPENITYEKVVSAIQQTSHLVRSVNLLDIHEDSKTLRLTYLDFDKSLTDEEVSNIRQKIATALRALRVKIK